MWRGKGGGAQIYGLTHKILVLNAYVQKPPLDANADAPITNKGLTFGLSLHLNPYFVYASNIGSGQTVHLCRLVWVFIARQCEK